MNKKIKWIMLVLLAVLIIMPVILLLIFNCRINWSEKFEEILIGVITYESTIILGFVANWIAISSQIQMKETRVMEQQIKNYEIEIERIRDNIDKISKAIENYDSRLFEYFISNLLVKDYKDMISIVNDGLHRIEQFQLRLEQIDDYYKINDKCKNCQKICKYDSSFRNLVYEFKNKTKEYIDLNFVSIGLMDKILRNNELKRENINSTYTMEKIKADLDKIMEYKESSFKLYTEIKGLIVTYKEACQQMIAENNERINELLNK